MAMIRQFILDSIVWDDTVVICSYNWSSW